MGGDERECERVGGMRGEGGMRGGGGKKGYEGERIGLEGV